MSWMNMGNLSLWDAKLKPTPEYPQKVLCSLGLRMDCRERSPSESLGTGQRKSKLLPGTHRLHKPVTLRNFYSESNSVRGSSSNPWSWSNKKVAKRENNGFLLSREAGLREEMLISDWVLTEFSLSFSSALSRGCFFNCLLSSAET